jgi:tetratricopeptide (TPR) repeat protein
MRVSTLLCFAMALLIAEQSAAQPQQNLTPEELSFTAVASAKNAASRVAAAEDFVKNFPKSARRPEAARLVAELLPTLRNPEIASALLERSKAIFPSADELAFINPVALEIYTKSNQADAAFKLAAELLSQKPDDLEVLVLMTHFGASQSRQSQRRYVEVSLQYGTRAIELIGKDEKPADVTDSLWSKREAMLSGLYQQTGILMHAQGNAAAAKEQIFKATRLGPKDPGSHAFLGRVLDEEYERQMVLYEAMPEGRSKENEKKRLDAMVDEMIDAYARAVGLATGKDEYQALLQQVVPNLTRYYRYRNQSVVGLRRLIEKYRY